MVKDGDHRPQHERDLAKDKANAGVNPSGPPVRGGVTVETDAAQRKALGQGS